MNIIETKINDVKIIEPIVFPDKRGYFFESFNQKQLIENGILNKWVQDNESKSKYGVLRGLHFQNPPYEQAKLVRVILGKVLDVAVDLRPNSSTFKQYVQVELSDENKRQLYIPRGFAHGFVVLSPEVIFAYKCDNYYHPESEGGISFKDPELNINWQIPFKQLIISEKDLIRKNMKEQNI